MSLAVNSGAGRPSCAAPNAALTNPSRAISVNARFMCPFVKLTRTCFRFIKQAPVGGFRKLKPALPGGPRQGLQHNAAVMRGGLEWYRLSEHDRRLVSILWVNQD